MGREETCVTLCWSCAERVWRGLVTSRDHARGSTRFRFWSRCGNRAGLPRKLDSGLSEAQHLYTATSLYLMIAWFSRHGYPVLWDARAAAQEQGYLGPNVRMVTCRDCCLELDAVGDPGQGPEDIKCGDISKKSWSVTNRQKSDIFGGRSAIGGRMLSELTCGTRVRRRWMTSSPCRQAFQEYRQLCRRGSARTLSLFVWRTRNAFVSASPASLCRLYAWSSGALQSKTAAVARSPRRHCCSSQQRSDRVSELDRWQRHHGQIAPCPFRR